LRASCRDADLQHRPRFRQTILVPKSGQHHQSDQGGSSDSNEAVAISPRSVKSGCRQKKKAAGRRPFSSAGWFSRGPRPRAELGGRSPRGTLRKHRSEGHSARPLFQSCFVERGNGFVLGTKLWTVVLAQHWLSPQPHLRPAAHAAVDKYHAGVFKRATRARPCCSGLSQARIPVRRLGGVWRVPPSPPRASRPVPVEF
jgi:hypothetical protein